MGFVNYNYNYTLCFMQARDVQKWGYHNDVKAKRKARTSLGLNILAIVFWIIIVVFVVAGVVISVASN